MNTRHLFPPLLLLLVGAWTAVAAASVRVERPRVEMLSRAEGVGEQHPEFSWQIASLQTGVMQRTYRITVATSRQRLESGHPDMWDSGTIASDQSAYIAYRGRPLRSGTRYYWRAEVETTAGKAVSQTHEWLTAMMSPGEWQAEWIGGKSAADVLTGKTRLPARYLRKDFQVQGRVSSAVLYICGLGACRAYVNGREVSDDVLSPTATNYDKSVAYNTYDVTALLRRGTNAIGAVLGGGRFTAMRNPGVRGFGLPRLLAQLVVTTTDGRTTTIVSDPTWQYTTAGPIRYSSEYDGELYDARQEMPGWNEPGYRAAGWTAAEKMAAPAREIYAQTNPNIRRQDTVKPKSIHRTLDGRYIIDMGQNFAGWMRVGVSAGRGDTLRMHFAERMQGADSIYTANLRTAETTDTYVSAGGSAVWEPSFTIHGFRYIELTGWKTAPRPEDFEGQVVYDEMATTGHFSTSSDVINSVYRCAYWGIRSNYRGMPMDCPQRDERMGWLGDRATGAYGEAFVYDNHLLYRKWARDIRELQRADSAVATIAPHYWTKYRDDVTWPMAWYTAVDMLWRQYGDSRPLRDNYEGMRRYLLRLKNRYMQDGVLVADHYGDWCLPPERPELIHSEDSTRITGKAVLASTAYHHLCGLMADFARALGKADDEKMWRETANGLRRDFNRKYYHPETGCYDNGTVTSGVLALRWGMVPEGEEQRVFAGVVEQTEKRFGSHIATGVLGTQEIMRCLTEYGREDLALTLATNTDFPSWGYMVKNGATTIWELWNGVTANPEMNSCNHVMLLGDLVIWYYQYLAGIRQRPDSRGYKHILLQPTFIRGLDRVDGAYQSIYGEIRSSWRRVQDTVVWDFTIPANTTADVCLPQADGTSRVARYGSGSYSVTLFQN